MSYEQLCTSPDTSPIILTAFASMLPSGVHDFTTPDEWQYYLSYRSSDYSLYEKADGSYFRVELSPGDMLILPPHTHHIDYIQRDRAEYDGFLIAVSCDPSVMPDQFSQFTPSSRTVSLFGKFRSEWDKRLPGYMLRCTILLYQLLDELSAQSRKQYMDSSKYRLIEPAILYIHEHYCAGSVPVTAMAEMCGITLQYFHRLFIGCMGVTPAHYVENLRLTRAKELLDSGNYSVRGAMEACGYDLATNFTRSFRRHFGVTPSSLLQKNLE